MTRDLELVRAILQWIEAREEGINLNWTITVDGFTQDQIGYHVHLMGQANLLMTVPTTNNESTAPSAVPLSITWAGHEFLDASKDRKLWAKAKTSVIGPAGGVAFSVLLEWLKAEAKTRLGIPP